MARRRAGRPPSGAAPGEKVVDYPQLNLRIPPEYHAVLRDLAHHLALPQWRVVCEALRLLRRQVKAKPPLRRSRDDS